MKLFPMTEAIFKIDFVLSSRESILLAMTSLIVLGILIWEKSGWAFHL